GEGHLFHHRKARRLVSGDFAKLGSLFQSFPSVSIDRPRERSRILKTASLVTTIKTIIPMPIIKPSIKDNS
uniref:hypothetical protein n=1 Tax=Pseudomonas syringae TaxID=317 RepID=UPI001FFA3900